MVLKTAIPFADNFRLSFDIRMLMVYLKNKAKGMLGVEAFQREGTNIVIHP